MKGADERNFHCANPHVRSFSLGWINMAGFTHNCLCEQDTHAEGGEEWKSLPLERAQGGLVFGKQATVKRGRSSPLEGRSD
jgi:hypothetical protein